MKKLNKQLAAILIALVLTAMLAVSGYAADVGRVTGLNASAISNNSVTLTWNKIAAADGYRIQVRIDGGAWNTLSEDLQTTSYTVKNLKLGSSYSFKVNAYDLVEVKVPILGVISTNKDHASYSTEVSISHSVGKVTGLKVASTTPTKVKLSWTKVEGAEGYLVQKKVDGSWKSVKTTTSTSYTVTGLKTGSTTPFRVKAYATNASGKRVYGSVSSTVNGKAAVAQVSNFKVTVKSLSSVQLSWSKISSVTGYQIYRKAGSGDWKKIKTITANSTVTYTNSSLTLGTKYQYKVRAYYKTDSKTYYGSYSDVVSITPKLPAVVGVEFSSFTTKNLAVITWDKVKDATGYQVYDYTSGKAVKVATVKNNKATITVNDNQITKIKVRAYTTVSGKTVTGTLSSIFEIYSTPAQVKNLDYATLPDNSLKLTWDKVSIAHGYKIEVINNSTAKWQTYAVTSENNYTIKDTNSLPGTNFRVSAFVKNNGTSLYGGTSNIITARIIQTPDIFEGETSSTSVTLVWSPVLEATTYILEKYNFDEDTWKVLKETYDTQYTDRVPQDAQGMGGIYRVYAKNPDGSRSAVSNELFVYSQGISVIQNGSAQTISWPAVDGASKYRIYVKSTYGDRGYLGTIINSSTNSATVTLTPDSIQSVVIHGYAANGDYVGCAVDELIIKTDKFKILDSSHVYYNYSINSQLLYLVNAINKTKHETGSVVVSTGSVVTYDTEKFFVNNTSFNGSNIQGLLSFINGITGFNKDSSDLKDIAFSGTETSKETLTFEDGIAKNTEGKSVNLAKYIDPSDEDCAYLYAGNDPLAWKEGVKSLSVAPTSNGGYKFVMVLYKEEYGTDTNSSQAYYHNGFATTVASFGQISTTNLENQLTTVGDTTITAVVNADGTLDSYQVTSPYTMKMKAPVDGILGISSFGMQIKGNVSSAYSFTR